MKQVGQNDDCLIRTLLRNALEQSETNQWNEAVRELESADTHCT